MHQRRQNSRASAFSVLFIALVIAGVAPVAEAQKNPLATPDQRAFEEQALRILASPVVQPQRTVIEKAFSEDPWYAAAYVRRFAER